MRTHRLLVLMPVSVVMLCFGVLTAQGISFGMPGAAKNKARELKDNRDRETIQRIPSLGTKSTTAGKGSKVRFVCEPGPGPAVAGYEWMASGGEFVGPAGAVATWVAPDVPGVYTITCRITDISGKVFQRSTTIPVRDPGTVKWTYAGNVRGCPAIAEDGTIYFCDTGGALHSVNPDGTANWVHPGAGAGPVIGEDGMIYTAGGTNVHAFTSAGLAWTVEVGFVSAIPIIDDVRHTLYLDNAAAIDLDNRTMKWSVAGTILPTTIGPDGTVYGTFTTNHINYLRAINPDGSLKWNSTATSYVGVEYFAASTVSVYFIHQEWGSRGPTRKVRAADGGVEWGNMYANGTSVVVTSEELIIGGLDSIYTVSADGYVVHVATDIVLNAYNFILGNDNTLYCTAYNRINAISMSEWRVDWDSVIVFTAQSYSPKHPTLADDGTLYVPTSNGLLHAIQATGSLAKDAVWPKWRRDLRNTGCATTR